MKREKTPSLHDRLPQTPKHPGETTERAMPAVKRPKTQKRMTSRHGNTK